LRLKTPVALLNLWHEQAKTLVSIGGVAFALLLVFAQLGFMGAVSYTATNVFENLNFDLLLRSQNYVHLYEAGSLDRRVLEVARNVEGVQAVSPFWITVLSWRRLDEYGQALPDSDLQAVAILGTEPESQAFRHPEINSLIKQGLVNLPTQLIIDSFTQAPFMPRDGQKFGPLDVKTMAEIGDARFTIEGVYRLGTGLAANGAVVTNDRGFARVLPWDTKTRVSLGLITISDPTQLHLVQEKLRQQLALPAPTSSEASTVVSILTRQEAMDAERYRWLWQTPIGLIFQLGVLISLVVGAAIVYMVLATDVTDRLPEYATLIAIGYSRLYLARQVMIQAVTLAVFGFVVAWIMAEVLYRITTAFSGIPMSMNSSRVLMVFALGFVMCCTSGLLALRKLWKAEPANLF
jgi:putative ABC transport system permease protein